MKQVISEYTPIFLSKIRLFISKDHNIDVSLYVSPDSVGFCIRSLGVSVDIARSAAGSNLLVAAVNKHMRRIHGTYLNLIIHQEDRQLSLINTYKRRLKRNGMSFKNTYIDTNDSIKDGMRSTLQLGIRADTTTNNITIKT